MEMKLPILLMSSSVILSRPRWIASSGRCARHPRREGVRRGGQPRQNIRTKDIRDCEKGIECAGVQGLEQGYVESRHEDGKVRMGRGKNKGTDGDLEEAVLAVADKLKAGVRQARLQALERLLADGWK